VNHKRSILPQPKHELGYSEQEVAYILFNLFREWMNGQTVGLDENNKFLYYPQDVENYIQGGPITD